MLPFTLDIYPTRAVQITFKDKNQVRLPLNRTVGIITRDIVFLFFFMIELSADGCSVCCSTDLICDVVHYNDTMSTSVVAGRDGTKPLLTCCIPLSGKETHVFDYWRCIEN